MYEMLVSVYEMKEIRLFYTLKLLSPSKNS